MVLEQFHLLIGQTIMYCQIIEHDVKRIYASMLKGNYYDNLEIVERQSLGQTLSKLKALDTSDNKPYISKDDYNFLKQMTEKRNHWCHETYQTFLYNKQFLQSSEYLDECRKLERDNEKLSSVCNVLEDVRIQAQKDFRNM